MLPIAFGRELGSEETLAPMSPLAPLHQDEPSPRRPTDAVKLIPDVIDSILSGWATTLSASFKSISSVEKTEPF